MKYVKIWDKVYLIDKITEKYACIHDTDDNLYTYHYDIKLDDNRAQFSDTIEELCDEFVLYHVILKHHQTDKLWWKMKLNLEEEDTKDLIIYGAIWTDKGLIYVAKLNEKGEWELI